MSRVFNLFGDFLGLEIGVKGRGDVAVYLRWQGSVQCKDDRIHGRLMENKVDVRDRSIAGNELAVWDRRGVRVDPCLDLRAAATLAAGSWGNAHGPQCKDIHIP